MAKKVISIKTVDTVKKIFEALKSPHHGFPVLNMNGQVIGLMPKNFLIVLIQKRCYYSDPGQKYHVVNGALKAFIKEKMLAANTTNTNEYAMNNQSDHDDNYSSHNLDSHHGLNKGESFRTQDFANLSHNSQLNIAKDKQGLKKQITQVIKGKDVESHKD
jgi:hypothetical protein